MHIFVNIHKNFEQDSIVIPRTPVWSMSPYAWAATVCNTPCSATQGQGSMPALGKITVKTTSSFHTHRVASGSSAWWLIVLTGMQLQGNWQPVVCMSCGLLIWFSFERWVRVCRQLPETYGRNMTNLHLIPASVMCRLCWKMDWLCLNFSLHICEVPVPLCWFFELIEGK